MFVLFCTNYLFCKKFSGCATHFEPNQTPAIMDPMSARAFGHASCTGMSIYMSSALRTIGIPARVVGTPAWHNHKADGNHNWIEIYMPGLNSKDVHDPWLFFGPKEGSGWKKFLTSKWLKSYQNDFS